MKRRGLRATFIAGAIGFAVVAFVVAFNWGIVRDHVEGWWFQARNKTSEIQPMPGVSWCLPCEFQALADESGQSVILPNNLDMDGHRVDRGPSALLALRNAGFRIIEQRFPRRAYVVVDYPEVSIPSDRMLPAQPRPRRQPPQVEVEARLVDRP